MLLPETDTRSCDAAASVLTAAGVIAELAAGDTIALYVGDVVARTARADGPESVVKVAGRDLDAVSAHSHRARTGARNRVRIDHERARKRGDIPATMRPT